MADTVIDLGGSAGKAVAPALLVSTFQGKGKACKLNHVTKIISVVRSMGEAGKQGDVVVGRKGEQRWTATVSRVTWNGASPVRQRW